jgi:hypothetical protein
LSRSGVAACRTIRLRGHTATLSALDQEARCRPSG